MSNPQITQAQVQYLTKALGKALDRRDLRTNLKRFWVFQNRTFVADFAYNGVHFGFDLTPVGKGKLSVDFVHRGRVQSGLSLNSGTQRKDRIILDATPNVAITAIVAQIVEAMTRIDLYRAKTAATDLDNAVPATGLADAPIDAAGSVPAAIPTAPEARTVPEPQQTEHEAFEPPTLGPKSAGRPRVGILTLPLGRNYGGNLQAYALMQTLRGLGCDPLLINRRYAAAAQSSQDAQDPVPAITNRIEIEGECENRSFIETHILPITCTFRSSAQLKARLKDYDLDAVISGSDQVWRAKYARGLLMDFFHAYLEGEDRSIRRISYAASFGSDVWEFSEKQTERAAHLVGQFDAVSVREGSAVELCREHLGTKAQHVLDPTLLLTPERYRALFADRLTAAAGRRITSYILDPNPEKLQLMSDISDRLSMKVLPAGSRLNANGTAVTDKSVEGWLTAFYQADFVLTDSFHGVAFSILFNKPFIAFANPLRGMARFTSILKVFGLQDRLVTDASIADIDQLLGPVDWIAVNHRLDLLRQNSVAFLRKALALLPGGGQTEPGGGSLTTPDLTRGRAVDQTTSPSAVPQPFNSSNPLKVLCTGCGVCVSEWLCCTKQIGGDSCGESSVVAGMHEQTYTNDLQDQELAGL